MPYLPHNRDMLDENINQISPAIITAGSAVLSQKATPVADPESAQTKELIQKMFDIMVRENGVGLAAPQINVSKQVAVISANGQRLVLINPKIISRSDDMIVFKEGCLSVPGKELDILRHQKVVIAHIDHNGKKNKLIAHDFLAVVCQHEIDHLNGILITDRHDRQTHLRKSLNISLNAL